jgi:hypothetical protein
MQRKLMLVADEEFVDPIDSIKDTKENIGKPTGTETVQAEQIKEVFDIYKSIKGDPFGQVYKGKRVNRQIVDLSEKTFQAFSNRLLVEYGTIYIQQNIIQDASDSTVLIITYQIFAYLYKYYRANLINAQKEHVKHLNNLTEELQYLDKLDKMHNISHEE